MRRLNSNNRECNPPEKKRKTGQKSITNWFVNDFASRRPVERENEENSEEIIVVDDLQIKKKLSNGNTLTNSPTDLVKPSVPSDVFGDLVSESLFLDALMITEFLRCSRLFDGCNATRLLEAVRGGDVGFYTITFPIFRALLPDILSSDEYKRFLCLGESLSVIPVKDFTLLEIIKALLQLQLYLSNIPEVTVDGGDEKLMKLSNSPKGTKSRKRKESSSSSEDISEGEVVLEEDSDGKEVDEDEGDSQSYGSLDEGKTKSEEADSNAVVLQDEEFRHRLLSRISPHLMSFYDLSPRTQIELLRFVVDCHLLVCPMDAPQLMEIKIATIRGEIAGLNDAIQQYLMNNPKLIPSDFNYQADSVQNGKKKKSRSKISKARERLAKLKAKLERLIDRSSSQCRVDPLGIDRLGRRYFFFPDVERGLFIQRLPSISSTVFKVREEWWNVNDSSSLGRLMEWLDDQDENEAKLIDQLKTFEDEILKKTTGRTSLGGGLRAREDVFAVWRDEMNGILTRSEEEGGVIKGANEIKPHVQNADKFGKALNCLRLVAEAVPFNYFKVLNFTKVPFSRKQFLQRVEHVSTMAEVYLLTMSLWQRVNFEAKKTRDTKSKKEREEKERAELLATTNNVPPPEYNPNIINPPSQEELNEIHRLLFVLRNSRLYRLLCDSRVPGATQFDQLETVGYTWKLGRFRFVLRDLFEKLSHYFESRMEFRADQFTELRLTVEKEMEKGMSIETDGDEPISQADRECVTRRLRALHSSSVYYTLVLISLPDLPHIHDLERNAHFLTVKSFDSELSRLWGAWRAYLEQNVPRKVEAFEKLLEKMASVDEENTDDKKNQTTQDEPNIGLTDRLRLFSMAELHPVRALVEEIDPEEINRFMQFKGEANEMEPSEFTCSFVRMIGRWKAIVEDEQPNLILDLEMQIAKHSNQMETKSYNAEIQRILQPLMKSRIGATLRGIRDERIISFDDFVHYAPATLTVKQFKEQLREMIEQWRAYILAKMPRKIEQFDEVIATLDLE